MKKRCRWVSFAAAVAMALLLTGCSLPMTGFADYDVSGYFRALLNSSYKGDIYSADPVKIACKCVSCKAEHIEYRNDL